MRRSECPRSGFGRGLLFLLLTLPVAFGLAACTNPQKAKVEHLHRGQQYLAEHKRDEALAELKRAVEINPQRIESLMGLARFYAQTGDVANAEATYQRALAVNANSALAHREYGVFLAQQHRNEQAEAE